MKNFKKGLDLVGRVAHTGDAGWVPYDTDLSYLIYSKEGDLKHFQGRENELTEENIRQAYCASDDDILYFARWEEPGEWTML